MQQAFLFNNAVCWGCKTCAVACAINRGTASGTFMRTVSDIRLDDPPVVAFLSMSCNHCERPACVEACAQGAYTKRDDGIVVQDHAKCIGCRACVEACPYGAPVYREDEGATYKCDLCAGRLDAGIAPWCVDACPGGCLSVNDLDALAASHPEGVRELAGITPAAGELGPALVILPDERLA